MDARDGYVDAGSGVQLFYWTAASGAESSVVLHGGPRS
jgi:hypothetical protein